MDQFFETHFGRIIETAVVLGITILVAWLEKILYNRMHPRLRKKNKDWIVAVVDALHRPLQVAIWIGGLSIATDVWTHFLDVPRIMAIFNPIRQVAALILVLWFLSALVKKTETRLMSKKEGHFDRTTVRALGQVFRAIIVFFALIVILQSVFSVPISGLLALAGGGGITIGFAAKDLIANFFGGLMIFLDRPFAIGDWIKIDEKKIEGIVEQIGWRLTRIRTFDKRPVYVPNSFFLNLLVENPSRMTNRRIKTMLGVRYQDEGKIAIIVEKIRKLINEHPEIDHNASKFVSFYAFGPSSLDIYISCYTIATTFAGYLPVQQEIFLKVLDILREEGAEVAFPTSTIHVPEPVALKQGN